MRTSGRACRCVFVLTLCTSLKAQFVGAPPSGSSPRVQQFPLEHPVPGAAAADPGSIIRGTIIPKAIDLTLEEAIQRGLRYNLSTIEASDTLRAARAQRLAAAAQLLPD